MMRLARFSRLVAPALLILLGVCLFGGCGKSYEGATRASVTGTVTLDGKPLPYGNILFMAEGSSRMASAVIQDGEYSITESQGPNIGEYKVQITGYASAPVPEDPDAEEGEDKGAGSEGQSAGPQIVPAKYNSSTELKVTIAAGPNEHDFPLTSE